MFFLQENQLLNEGYLSYLKDRGVFTMLNILDTIKKEDVASNITKIAVEVKFNNISENDDTSWIDQALTNFGFVKQEADDFSIGETESGVYGTDSSETWSYSYTVGFGESFPEARAKAEAEIQSDVAFIARNNHSALSISYDKGTSTISVKGNVVYTMNKNLISSIANMQVL